MGARRLIGGAFGSELAATEDGVGDEGDVVSESGNRAAIMELSETVLPVTGHGGAAYIRRLSLSLGIDWLLKSDTNSPNFRNSDPPCN